MKIKSKLLLAELTLIIASVLIFRGLWMILDTVAFMNKFLALLFSLIIGIVVSIPALRYVIRNS
ncbi:MAG: hypothetical protein HYT68_00770 [Candidatus Zambryskibacteria bacterium]|nr:hypothetical protein [Candidatus Zambryskibacteria bacterium]